MEVWKINSVNIKNTQRFSKKKHVSAHSTAECYNSLFPRPKIIRQVSLWKYMES